MPVVEENYDVVVVGAGHAGCEAALASARLGLETILFTVSMDSVAMMPCNPNVGGSSKGHLVRELDALGGEMGKNIDKTYIQSKMLNASKGPAVHSLRAQADKSNYSRTMKHTLENTDHLVLRQAEVSELMVTDGVVKGVKTFSGATYYAKAVVLCTGTYLKARCIYGDVVNHTGPNGLMAANHLSDSMKEAGIGIRRFKTGTPARLDKRTIDFSQMEEQKGDEHIVPFSFTNTEEDIKRDQVSCWLCYTNEKTHEIIRENINRSPLFSGVIEGTGPRYCPSIEDKVMKFPDKTRHQIFIEPEGEFTNEMYMGGMSSSLPEDVQYKMIRSMKGLENVRIVRNAYAIEYDIVDPTELYSTLEFKKLPGLYGAGQFNGSSGYEEAAAQGLVAGINAALKIKGEPPMILDRGSSYIGTLVDDLVTKGVNDPYRMMTSRSEYRLVLRQDNADERLTPIGRKIGLISDKQWEDFLERKRLKEAEIERIKTVVISPSERLSEIMTAKGTAPLTTGIKMIDLLKRPQITYDDLAEFDPSRPEIDDSIFEKVSVEIKYEGYIKRQLRQVSEMRRLENKLLSPETDYKSIRGLRLEAIEKLSKIKPLNIGQASRISGVSPADISVIMIWLSTNSSKEVENS